MTLIQGVAVEEMDLVHDNSSPAPTPTANRAIRLQLENYASYAYIRVNFPRTEKMAKNVPFVEAKYIIFVGKKYHVCCQNISFLGGKMSSSLSRILRVSFF